MEAVKVAVAVGVTDCIDCSCYRHTEGQPMSSHRMVSGIPRRVAATLKP
jgi:hypothetical protein